MLSEFFNSIFFIIISLFNQEEKVSNYNQNTNPQEIIDINPVQETEITQKDFERTRMFSAEFCGPIQAKLFEGIIKFNQEKIKEALDAGADINKPVNGFYPIDEAIEQAIRYKQEFILEYLIDHGAIISKNHFTRLKYKRHAFETNQVPNIDDIQKDIENLKKMQSNPPPSSVLIDVDKLLQKQRLNLKYLTEIILHPVQTDEEKIQQVKLVNKILQDNIEECNVIENLFNSKLQAHEDTIFESESFGKSLTPQETKQNNSKAQTSADAKSS